MMRFYETFCFVIPDINRCNRSQETNSLKIDLYLGVICFEVDTKRNRRSISVNKIINNIEKYCKYATILSL